MMTYLLTFRCYGTWLHGDPRGSVDRDHNTPGSPLLEANASRQQYERSLMTEEPYELGPSYREQVLTAIRALCERRQWRLTAAHVLADHVHVVAEIEGTPERAIGEMKAYASMQLRQTVDGRKKRWARYGSTVQLRDRRAIESAVRYVMDEQGTRMCCYLDPDW